MVKWFIVADRRSGLRPIACAPGHQPGVQYIRPFQGRGTVAPAQWWWVSSPLGCVSIQKHLPLANGILCSGRFQKGIQLAGCFRHIAFSQELPGMIHFKHWIPPPSACRKGPEDALPHLLSSGFLPFEGKQCPPFCSLIMVIHFGMRWVIFSRPFRSIIVRP